MLQSEQQLPEFEAIGREGLRPESLQQKKKKKEKNLNVILKEKFLKACVQLDTTCQIKYSSEVQ